MRRLDSTENFDDLYSTPENTRRELEELLGHALEKKSIKYRLLELIKIFRGGIKDAGVNIEINKRNEECSTEIRFNNHQKQGLGDQLIINSLPLNTLSSNFYSGIDFTRSDDDLFRYLCIESVVVKYKKLNDNHSAPELLPDSLEFELYFSENSGYTKETISINSSAGSIIAKFIKTELDRLKKS